VDNARGAIDPDSSIDFSGYPHYAELPQLSHFASLGFPFTRHADLSQTAVVMPEQPGREDIETLLTLLGRMGESTGYPGHDHDEIEPTEDHRKLAERRVRLGLLLAEIGNKHEITVAEQELQRAIFSQARQYPGQERQFLDFVQKNPQALQQIRAPLFEDKVVDFILELATVTEKPVSKDELQKAIEALDAEGEAAATPAADETSSA
jgi:hypothetical protein